MARNEAIVIRALSSFGAFMLASCSPTVTLEQFDAGTLPSCDGRSVCLNENECPEEDRCIDEWCQADKGDLRHWCVGKDGGL